MNFNLLNDITYPCLLLTHDKILFLTTPSLKLSTPSASFNDCAATANMNLTFNYNSKFTGFYQKWTAPPIDQLDFSKKEKTVIKLVGQWART